MFAVFSMSHGNFSLSRMIRRVSSVDRDMCMLCSKSDSVQDSVPDEQYFALANP